MDPIRPGAGPAQGLADAAPAELPETDVTGASGQPGPPTASGDLAPEADRLEAPAPAARTPRAGAMARWIVSNGPSLDAAIRTLEGYVAAPAGARAFDRATSDLGPFVASLEGAALAKGMSPVDARRLVGVALDAVAGIQGERVRDAALSRIDAKLHQVARLAREMRAHAGPRPLVRRFFARLSALPAPARQAVIAAHHLDRAPTSALDDGTWEVFERTPEAHAALETLLATGTAELRGVHLDLAKMAAGLDGLSHDLLAARDYVERCDEPLLVLRPITRRFAARDRRVGMSFDLRADVEAGGIAIHDPKDRGLLQGLADSLDGRDVDLASALFAAGVADRTEVDLTRHAHRAQMAALPVGVATAAWSAAKAPFTLLAKKGMRHERRGLEDALFRHVGDDAELRYQRTAVRMERATRFFESLSPSGLFRLAVSGSGRDMGGLLAPGGADWDGGL